VNQFRLKACLKCGGDLALDEGDWLCLQCGRYYYVGLYRHKRWVQVHAPQVQPDNNKSWAVLPVAPRDGAAANTCSTDGAFPRQLETVSI